MGILGAFPCVSRLFWVDNSTLVYLFLELGWHYHFWYCHHQRCNHQLFRLADLRFDSPRTEADLEKLERKV